MNKKTINDFVDFVRERSQNACFDYDAFDPRIVNCCASYVKPDTLSCEALLLAIMFEYECNFHPETGLLEGRDEIFTYASINNHSLPRGLKTLPMADPSKLYFMGYGELAWFNEILRRAGVFYPAGRVAVAMKNLMKRKFVLEERDLDLGLNRCGTYRYGSIFFLSNNCIYAFKDNLDGIVKSASRSGGVLGFPHDSSENLTSHLFVRC